MKKKVARKPVKKAKKPVSVRKPVKKPAKKTARKPLKKKLAASREGKIVGKITHYFPQVNAAVIKLQVPLALGDTIKVKGHTTDFTEQITSMQINRVPVQSAKVGDEIGLLVKSRVRKGDIVTKL
ncbi:MAG TPA: hypothetical protein PK562_02015 [Candidatus Omnitrophota bacterium]|nr:hypothetical protein [Candidatus Omnitrophota bacterium]